jgi:hypothetical protein
MAWGGGGRHDDHNATCDVITGAEKLSSTLETGKSIVYIPSANSVIAIKWLKSNITYCAYTRKFCYLFISSSE